MRVLLAPRFEWGATAPTITRGSNHIRYVGPDFSAAPEHRRAGLARARRDSPSCSTREHNFVLGADETLTDGIADTARRFEQETIAYWRTWSKRAGDPASSGRTR